MTLYDQINTGASRYICEMEMYTVIVFSPHIAQAVLGVGCSCMSSHVLTICVFVTWVRTAQKEAY